MYRCLLSSLEYAGFLLFLLWYLVTNIEYLGYDRGYNLWMAYLLCEVLYVQLRLVLRIAGMRVYVWLLRQVACWEAMS